MPETSGEILDKCIAEGFLRKQQEYDLNLIKSIVNIAKEDMIQLRKLIAGTKQNDEGWSSIYKMAYDVIHELVDAFLRFDYVKSDNHICMFAHLCERHPELELDWQFFENTKKSSDFWCPKICNANF